MPPEDDSLYYADILITIENYVIKSMTTPPPPKKKKCKQTTAPPPLPPKKKKNYENDLQQVLAMPLTT